MFRLLYLYFFRLRWALAWWFTEEADMCFINTVSTRKQLFINGYTYPKKYWPDNDRVLSTQAPTGIYFEDCDLTRLFRPGTPQVYTKFMAIQSNSKERKPPIRVQWRDFPFLEELHLVRQVIDLNDLKPLKYLRILYLDDKDDYTIPAFLQGKIRIRGKTVYNEDWEKWLKQKTRF